MLAPQEYLLGEHPFSGPLESLLEESHMDEQKLREALQVAKETVDGWKVHDDGRVYVHKDVISKAIEAAIEASQ